jgi:hypothetical protein
MSFLKKSVKPTANPKNQLNIVFGHFGMGNPVLSDFNALTGPNSSASCSVDRFGDGLSLDKLRAFALGKAHSSFKYSTGLRLYFVGDGEAEDLEVMSSDDDFSSKVYDFFATFTNGGGVCNILGEPAAKEAESSPPTPTSLQARLMQPPQSPSMFRTAVAVSPADKAAGVRAVESALAPHSSVSRCCLVVPVTRARVVSVM